MSSLWVADMDLPAPEAVQCAWWRMRRIRSMVTSSTPIAVRRAVTRDFVRTFMQQQLHRIKLIEPDGTYLLWLDCREMKLSDKQDALNNQPQHFGESGFMRMNIGAPARSLQKRCKESRAQNECDSEAVRHDLPLRNTSPMPPKINTEAVSKFGVNASFSNTIPPNAASIGALSCTVEAVIACMCCSTRYHNT